MARGLQENEIFDLLGDGNVSELDFSDEELLLIINCILDAKEKRTYFAQNVMSIYVLMEPVIVFLIFTNEKVILYFFTM
jgi:hypothetical protein